VTGLNAALPISFSQICSRRLRSTGQRRPPALNACEISRQRSDSSPSGSPIVKRVPSMWRMTPGATISVEQ